MLCVFPLGHGIFRAQNPTYKICFVMCFVIFRSESYLESSPSVLVLRIWKLLSSVQSRR